MQGILALEDGRVFYGESFGAQGERSGEIVFNTSLTGYQEVLTDPSYRGQIVSMTYPHIGNYGINEQDVESAEVRVEGFVVRDYSAAFSNWRARQSLADYLAAHGVIALTEVDTRALTRHIRSRGAMKAVISTADPDPESLVEKARRSPGLVGRDLVREVTCPEGLRLGRGDRRALAGRRRRPASERPLQGGGVRFRRQVQYTALGPRRGVRPDGRAGVHFGARGARARPRRHSALQRPGRP